LEFVSSIPPISYLLQTTTTTLETNTFILAMTPPTGTPQLNWQKGEIEQDKSLTFIEWDALKRYATNARRQVDGAECSCQLSAEYNMGGLHVVRRVEFGDYCSNIIIDTDYNVLSVIDWENALVGPWELVEFNKQLSICPSRHGWPAVQGDGAEEGYGTRSGRVREARPDGRRKTPS
jgi:hypothetical protein